MNAGGAPPSSELDTMLRDLCSGVNVIIMPALHHKIWFGTALAEGWRQWRGFRRCCRRCAGDSEDRICRCPLAIASLQRPQTDLRLACGVFRCFELRMVKVESVSRRRAPVSGAISC
jgi:hypothetical protein